MGRAPCCDKANVKKGPWSPEEDAKLKAYIEQFGTGGNWIALPQKIGLKRCGKSCRLRWLNYLRPNIKHGGFSEEEDNIICSLYISIGSRWSIIAAQLPGRTDNDIKNYWNTRLKKKLLGRRKQSHVNRLTGSSGQDPKDVNSVENLSSSAIERLQLHMQLQSPFSFYTNPALWPKLNPLQEKMIQQSLQLVNDSSNPNPTNPLMQNVSPSSQLGEGQKIYQLYQSSNQDYSTLEDELDNSINGMPSSASTIQLKIGISTIMGSSVIQKSDAGKQSNNVEFQGVPTFQAELDDDFLMNNNQIGEFDCFKEMDGSKDNQIWWSSDFETNSASSNSWDSTSVLHHQSEIGCQDFVQGYSMH